RRRMDSEEQRVEVEDVVRRDHDFAVENAALRKVFAKGNGQLGEVTVERLQVTALRVDLVAVAKDHRAEAVPLRFVEPCIPLGDLVRELCEHRSDGRTERKRHARAIASLAALVSSTAPPARPAGAPALCSRTSP